MPLHQLHGPQLAPYAEALSAAGYHAGGNRLGKSSWVVAYWFLPYGPRYCVHVKATEGEELVQGSLMREAPTREEPSQHLFRNMRLDTPADLLRLLAQCVELAAARQAETVAPPRGRHPVNQELILEPLAPFSSPAGFSHSQSPR